MVTRNFSAECNDTDHFWFVCHKCNKEAEITSVTVCKSKKGGRRCIQFFLKCNCGETGSRKTRQDELIMIGKNWTKI